MFTPLHSQAQHFFMQAEMEEEITFFKLLM